MATTSTVPTTRSALLAALTAAFPTAQVTYQHPGDATEAEMVYLGETRLTSEYATIRAGRKHRQERYTIDVWFDVGTDGPDAQAAVQRVWDMAGELEDVLADDPSLGLGQPFWAGVGSATETLFFDEAHRGFGSLLRVGVDCEARLT